jgi:cytochrome c oxidase accessory protein FixG
MIAQPGQFSSDAAPAISQADRLAEEHKKVLSTLQQDGRRRWIKPKPSCGTFWHRRRGVAYLLIAIFTLLPYLKLNEKPLVLLDVARREFTLFGYTFLPTDTLLLALLLVGIALTVFLMTAIFGRVWCGWGCPQTVYLEFVYRPIERFFEGTPGGKTPKSAVAARKVFKYLAFLAVSLFLAHTFLSYFVGIDELRVWITRSPLEHPSSFLIVMAVTAAMMFDFAFFREQTCIVACPYGRFQSVLLDRGSLVVGYDRLRGEPRGKGKRPTTSDVSLKVLASDPASSPAANTATSKSLGDCIDCHMCVTTCPTGIDIRDGLQMECVHCTQCIDACDSIMAKIGKPPGLIRYGTPSSFEGKPVRRLRPRVIVYPLLLMLVIAAFFAVLFSKGAADVKLFRGPGMPYTVLQNGEVANQLKLKIANRTREPRSYTIELIEPVGGRIELPSNPLRIEPVAQMTEPIGFVIPASAFDATGKAKAVVRVSAPPAAGEPAGFTEEIRSVLLGPAGIAGGSIR